MTWNEPDKFLQSSDRPRKMSIEFVAKKYLTTSFPCCEEIQWLRPFGMNWIKINDLGSLRLWWAKRTNKSFPRVDSLVAWKPKEELRSIYERIGCLDLPESFFFYSFPLTPISTLISSVVQTWQCLQKAPWSWSILGNWINTFRTDQLGHCQFSILILFLV